MTVSWMLAALLAAACPAQDGVLRAAATAVQAQYLDEAEGARIADALRTWSVQQRYADSCSDPVAFSARLNHTWTCSMATSTLNAWTQRPARTIG